jgi:hypothetical protein
MRRAFQEHADGVLARELRRVPEEQRTRIAAACAQVTAAVVECVLEDARGGATRGGGARLHLRIG